MTAAAGVGSFDFGWRLVLFGTTSRLDVGGKDDLSFGTNPNGSLFWMFP